eukprot:7117292-Alexandrium_andersonii.AAC.1
MLRQSERSGALLMDAHEILLCRLAFCARAASVAVAPQLGLPAHAPVDTASLVICCAYARWACTLSASRNGKPAVTHSSNMAFSSRGPRS